MSPLYKLFSSAFPRTTVGTLEKKEWYYPRTKSISVYTIRHIIDWIYDKFQVYCFPWHQLLPLISPCVTVCVSGNNKHVIIIITVNKCISVKCNRSTLNQNLIVNTIFRLCQSAYVLNQLIQVTPNIDWCNKVKAIQDLKQSSRHLGKRQFVCHKRDTLHNCILLWVCIWHVITSILSVWMTFPSYKSFIEMVYDIIKQYHSPTESTH